MRTPLPVSQIIEVFNKRLGARYGVRLKGGGAEPFYQAPKAAECALIVFRADYSASALHEVAHWCLAGRQRRQLDDYGYWYLPARNAAQQAAFEAVEARPQALEALFAEAAGVDFQVSSDDVASLPSPAFKARVAAERRLIEQQLPVRARCFLAALQGANALIAPTASRTASVTASVTASGTVSQSVAGSRTVNA